MFVSLAKTKYTRVKVKRVKQTTVVYTRLQVTVKKEKKKEAVYCVSWWLLYQSLG